LDVVDRAAKVSGVLVAAAWAYWNHKRGRTFSSRLDAAIDVELVDLAHGIWIVDVSIKNIGNALIQLGEIRACRIVYLDIDLAERSVEAYKVFETEQSLEPGESLRERLLLKSPINEDFAILKAQLIVDGQGRSEDRWKADKVCLIRKDSDNERSYQDHGQGSSKTRGDRAYQKGNPGNAPQGKHRKGVKGAVEPMHRRYPSSLP